MKSGQIREDYFFASIDRNNYDTIRGYVQRAKFPQFIAINPIHWGFYNQPFSTSNFDDFNHLKDALLSFKNAGIKIGIHTFLNLMRMQWGDTNINTLIDFTNPEPDLKDAILNYPIGHLAVELFDGTTTSIVTDVPDLAADQDFRYYYHHEGSYPGFDGRAIIIDNEILECNSYLKETLTCARGVHTTHSAAHPFGAEIYLAPRAQGIGAFFINPEGVFTTGINKDRKLIDVSVESFVNGLQPLGVDFLYFDGDSFVPPPEARNNPFMYWAFTSKYGILPYLREWNRVNVKIVNNKEQHSVPLIQGGQSFNSYIQTRAATDDGGIFKAKYQTKFKAKQIYDANPYDGITPEFGWWKFNGAQFSLTGNKLFDQNATDFDDVHYVMTKSATLPAAVGVEMWGGEVNKRLNDLLDLMANYHDLIKKDIDSGLPTPPLDSFPIPSVIKNTLREVDNEAEISTIAGYHFIRKKYNRFYFQPETSLQTFDNPYGTQKIKLQLRPKFDYYDYSLTDVGHIPIRENLVGLTAIPSKIDDPDDPNDPNDTVDPGVVCTIDTAGNVTVNNKQTAYAGGCKIDLPVNLSLADHRGFGMTVTGDGHDELVVLRLGKTFELRDYKFTVDFTGERTIILGDPTGDNEDFVGGLKTQWNEYLAKVRHWDFNYVSPHPVSIFINVEKNTTALVKLSNLKALQEKGKSIIKNPAITLNDKTVQFPVTLSVDDHAPYILEYNGFDNTYSTYTPNFENDAINCNGCVANATATIYTTDLLATQGTNEISFSAENGPLNGQRSEVILNVYDDEDGDGVPTDGDFVNTITTQPIPPHTMCNGTNNFCDDNCPGVSNLDQTDSNHDGTGDACSGNQRPVVEAGDNQSITLPVNQVTLNGSATDDELPEGATLTYLWSMFSGPAAVTFDDPTKPNAVATFSQAGTYILKLTVSDSQLSGEDSVQIIVSSALPPTVTLQPETSQIYSNLQLQFKATASDSDGSITRYRCDFGDGTVIENGLNTEMHTFTSASNPTVTVTVYDNDGLSASASQTITIYPPKVAPTLSINPGSNQTVHPDEPLSVTLTVNDPDGLALDLNRDGSMDGSDGAIFDNCKTNGCQVYDFNGIPPVNNFDRNILTSFIPTPPNPAIHKIRTTGLPAIPVNPPTLTKTAGDQNTSTWAWTWTPAPTETGTYTVQFTTDDGWVDPAATAHKKSIQVQVVQGQPTDTDLAGLPDNWEIQYFGNITSKGASGDPDGDGLNNLAEYQHNTKPNNPDCDSDGITDGDEVNAGTDPNVINFHGKITVSGSTTIHPGDLVSFTGSCFAKCENAPFTYKWNFEDLYIPDISGVSATKIFPHIGVWTVKLDLTDNLGQKDPVPATVKITVAPQPVDMKAISWNLTVYDPVTENPTTDLANTITTHKYAQATITTDIQNAKWYKIEPGTGAGCYKQTRIQWFDRKEFTFRFKNGWFDTSAQLGEVCVQVSAWSEKKKYNIF